MMPYLRGLYRRILLTLALLLPVTAFAQSGNAGAVRGTVSDPSGAVIPGATVHLSNTVSGLDRTTTSDPSGQFEFTNVPLNPYQIKIMANGFAPITQNVEIRSSIGVSLKLVLRIAGSSDTVTVEAAGFSKFIQENIVRPNVRWKRRFAPFRASGIYPCKMLRITACSNLG